MRVEDTDDHTGILGFTDRFIKILWTVTVEFRGFVIRKGRSVTEMEDLVVFL